MKNEQQLSEMADREYKKDKGKIDNRSLDEQLERCGGFIVGFKKGYQACQEEMKQMQKINSCNECSKELESGTIFCSVDCRIHYYS